MKSQIYLNKVVENGCLFRKGIECSNCGYCQSNTNKSIKKLNAYYDYELEMLFYEYLISNNEDLELGNVIELTFEDDNDTDIYKYKIVKKDKDTFILAQYYDNYCKVREGLVAFDHGVKTINAIKELGVIL